MIIRPCSVAEAKRVCERVHRRHPSMTGALWAIVALADDAQPWRPKVGYRDQDVLGIATVGRPPRAAQLGAERLVVTRIAALADLPRIDGHASSVCSALYGASARAARAMGAVDLWTYLHEDEPGVSLRAAGWICDGGLTRDESHDRPSRHRSDEHSGRKTRWWAPWSASLPAMRARFAEAA